MRNQSIHRELLGCFAVLVLAATPGAALGSTVAATSEAAVTIGVLPFSDATASGNAELGLSLGRAVQAEIVHSTSLRGRVLALGETRPDEVDAKRAIEMGRKGHVDLVLVGTLLDSSVDDSSKGGWMPGILGQSAGGKIHSIRAKVTLQGDLFRVADGKLLGSLRATGSHSEKKFSGSLDTGFGSWATDEGTFLHSPLGMALQQAIADLVKRVAAAQQVKGKT